MTNLNEFIGWQAEKPNRSVTIEIGKSPLDKVRIFVYDDSLYVGQFVNSVDEINLELEVERREKLELERLSKKYGASI